MSTLAEIGESRARRSPIPRFLFWALVVFLLVIAAAMGCAYRLAHAALPQLDGQLPVSGLGSMVTVTRDGHGVPTVTAASPDDLFFAQGYVTAQDRLWQMDVMRRFASGELSEILGEETLKLDREQRILGLRAAAQKSLQAASDRDRAFFAAYGLREFQKSSPKLKFADP